MIGLAPAGKAPSRILCIGAHCDDIEIGCAGTLLEMQTSGSAGTIDWVVLTGDEQRQAESSAAFHQLVDEGHRGELVFGGFPDARLPAVYGELKSFFDSLRRRFSPDIVFTHGREDLHQDHRVCNEMTWGSFRDHLILEYEIIKWDGDFTVPNVYSPIDMQFVRRKIDVLMSVYGTQRSKDWFLPDTFESVMRLRGIECRAPSRHAEAFTVRKLLLAPGADGR